MADQHVHHGIEFRVEFYVEIRMRPAVGFIEMQYERKRQRGNVGALENYPRIRLA